MSSILPFLALVAFTVAAQQVMVPADVAPSHLDGQVVAAQVEAERLAAPILNMVGGWGSETLKPFISGCITSFCIIVVSEIGDKTFFIAALLAMKRGALNTFCGAATALAIMTILSAVVGRALPAVLDPHWTRLASIFLFVFFGFKLLWEGYNMETSEEGPAELAEVEQALASSIEDKKDKPLDLEGSPREFVEQVAMSSTHLPPASAAQSSCRSARLIFAILRRYISHVPLLFVSGAFMEACSLTFAAEWGDRSQIATFALGASKDFLGVNIGAILGHMSCTAVAVLGGKVLASRISERVVAFIGGTVFLFFAVAGWYMDHYQAAPSV